MYFLITREKARFTENRMICNDQESEFSAIISQKGTDLHNNPIGGIEMKNSKKVMLSLAMVAVIVVSAIGIGFAYTASTSNTSNTVDAGYLKATLRDSTNNSAAAYVSNFSGSIKYNTETIYEDSHEYVRYTFDSSQVDADTDPGIPGNDAVTVGSGVFLNIEHVNVIDTFKVIMTNESEGMSPLYSYVVGYDYGADKDQLTGINTYVAFDPACGCTFTTDFPNTVGVILINLYVRGMSGSQMLPIDEAMSLIKPLDNVTFKFTAASSTSITTHALTVDYDNTHGLIVTDPVLPEALHAGNEVKITITPNPGYRIGTFALNGIDYMSKLSIDGSGIGTFTVTMDNKDVVVTSTFVAKTYTIALDKNGGSELVNTVDVTYGSSAVTYKLNGETVTPFVAPTAAGTFQGYYTALSDGTKVINADGALVTNASGYTGEGKWIRTDSVATLYAIFS